MNEVYTRGQIKDLFKHPRKTMAMGLWFSGIEEEGEFKSWHEVNGKLAEHAFFKNGDFHGNRKFWYENGQISREMHYKNGKLNGEFKEWEDNGDIIEHSVYKNGKKVEEIVSPNEK